MPRMPYTNFHDLNLNWFLKEFKKIIAAVSGKQDAPAQPGTAGQVLGLNEGLQPVWIDQGAGTVDYSELENKPRINGVELSGNKTGSEYGVIDTPAAPGTAGQVLGLDASLTPKWIDQEGGSVDLDITGTASGAVASFDDGANNEPLEDLQIAIEPVQAGTGDPSPDNVRPISGWTGCKVTRTGKNLLDLSILRQGSFDNTVSQSNVSFDEFLPIVGGLQYVWSSAFSNISGRYIRCYDATKTPVGTGIALYGVGAKTFTVPENACYFRAMWYISGGIQPADITEDQIELGSSATAYEPYQGQTYSITFGDAGTVYGGTLNPVTGELIVTDAEIESYNGETLPSTWISDRDVYAEGATPTIGAQVVYKLAEPLEYDLSHTEIRTLLGNNNIWANTGDILQCVYKVDLDIYLRNVTKVKILTPTENTQVMKPFPTTYNFGERTALTLTVTSDTYYKFMFKCPDNAVTNITINGANDTAGDIPAAGKTYIVEIWAGIANYTELVLAVG